MMAKKISDNIMIAGSALLCFAAVAVVCSPSGSDREPVPPTAEQTKPPVDDPRVLLAEYLPDGYVEDGTVDYTQALTDAGISAAGGTLVLPDFPIRVMAVPGQSYAVLFTEGLTLEGSPGSSIVVFEEGVQALRFEEPDGATLRDFTVAGPDVDGAGLAHGLVQITGGRRIRIEGLTVTGADADGIAVAGAEDVTIVDCVVSGASKSSLYVSSSRRVRVSGNTVNDFGGHATPRGDVVGAGIQLSSNAEVLCSDNVIDTGVGSGILCNALMDGEAPTGNVITNNRIMGAVNQVNVDASSGIRLANGAALTLTRTVVAGNSIHGCGAHGVFVENHDGCTIQGNWISEIARCGVVVGSIRGALIAGNVMSDIGTDAVPGLDVIQLVNGADGVVVRDNMVQPRTLGRAGSAHLRVRDHSEGMSNSIFPREQMGEGPPANGQWYRGDVILDSTPDPGGPYGWVCTTTGIPGQWQPFGTQ